jgi:hypothetical protein
MPVVSMFRSNVNNNDIYSLFPRNNNLSLGFIEDYLKKAEKNIEIRITQAVIKFLKENYINNDKIYCDLINNKDVRKIIEYYHEFSLGRIESLKTKLTLDEYNLLSVTLNQLKIDDNPDSCYEKLRLNIVRSLEALMKAIYIYDDLTAYKNNQQKYDIWKNTYFDINLLIKRYNELKNGATTFFDNLIIDAPLLTIKQEYSIYIQKYGFPEGGIFEADKIAEILETFKL